MKKFFIIIFCLIIITASVIPASADLSLTTYADSSPTSSNTTNLINMAINYPSFAQKTCDYIVFQNAQYSYCIAWGDLSKSGNFVSGSDIKVLQYTRTGTTQNYKYEYFYSEQGSFSLTLNHQIVSNIDRLGFSAPVYRDFKNDFISSNFFILLIALMFALFCLTMRGGLTK